MEDKIRGNVYQALAWVALSERHLTLRELLFIFSLHWSSPGVLLPNRELISLALLDPQIFIAPLSGLLSTYPLTNPYAEDELSRTGVRLAHFSVKEFLREEGHRYEFRHYSLQENDARCFIVDSSLAVMKRWIALRSGSESMPLEEDVGQLAIVFGLTWPQ